LYPNEKNARTQKNGGGFSGTVVPYKKDISYGQRIYIEPFYIADCPGVYCFFHQGK
jgi:hypothetical protein